MTAHAMARPEAAPASSGPVTVRVVADPAGLAPEWCGWDGLSEAAERPYCSPGWMVPWWNRARPAGSRLHLVEIRRGPALIGVAPLYLTRDRWGVTTARLLADTASSYSEPLAAAGEQREVAAGITGALAEARVDVVALAAVPRTSHWPALLQETWPGPHPRLVPVATMAAPYVEVSPAGPEEWFGGRSRNFRQQVRRRRRAFLGRGGRFQLAATRAEMTTALADFRRLHDARWADRGGSRALDGAIGGMLAQAAVALGPSRLQLWTASMAGSPIASALFVRAGGQVHYWLGGFDQAWASLSPSVLLLVAAIEHAHRPGVARVSLGPGPQPYKYRLATGEEELAWWDLLPRGGRHAYVAARRAPQQLRRTLAARTPPELTLPVKRAVTRLAAGHPSGPHP